MSNAGTIENIRDRAASDAEALAQIFESPAIADDRTPAGRLRTILAATESTVVPGLQTGIKFHDSGFRKEFKDPWPSSDNQVGHFLTAVGLSFNPAKVEQNFVVARLRDWIRAPSTMTAEEVAIRLTIGHEKAPDPSITTVIEGAESGAMQPLRLATFVTSPVEALDFAAGAAAGAARGVLDAFRAQFAACTNHDVQLFRAAEGGLGRGTPLDIGAASARLRGIRVVSTGRGNSYEDLLLSLYDWRLGQDIKNGRFRTGAEIAVWIRANLM